MKFLSGVNCTQKEIYQCGDGLGQMKVCLKVSSKIEQVIYEPSKKHNNV